MGASANWSWRDREKGESLYFSLCAPHRKLVMGATLIYSTLYSISAISSRVQREARRIRLPARKNAIRTPRSLGTRLVAVIQNGVHFENPRASLRI